MAASSDSVPFKVDGKTAIITGAGSGMSISYCPISISLTDNIVGINLAFAKLLLSRNCNVLIGDLSLRPEAQEMVDEYSSKDGHKPRAVFVKTNVTNWNDLANMFDQADEEFGGADIVRSISLIALDLSP